MNSLQGHSMCKSPEVDRQARCEWGAPAVCTRSICCNHHARETLQEDVMFLSPCPADPVPVGSLLFAAQRLFLRSNSLELELLIGFWGFHLSPILGESLTDEEIQDQRGRVST